MSASPPKKSWVFTSQVRLETPHPCHHCESQQARWAFKTNMPPNNRCDCSAHAIPVAGQVSAVVRHASLVTRSSHPKGPSRHVQPCAARWILQTLVGEVSYKDRLIKLDLLPLSYDRGLKDLSFFYKCLYNHIDLNVHCFVDFISHGRSRLSNSLNLKTPICRTSTFQASYFNRIIKLWNFTCSVLPSTSFDNPGSF